MTPFLRASSSSVVGGSSSSTQASIHLGERREAGFRLEDRPGGGGGGAKGEFAKVRGE